ncbi:hypothetical protein C8R47DRAFT_1214156 [Mycena vitilis]|nr:hypothetical protein C8R47DRAFT_1214156 [Mycena vitilis]
MSTRAGLGWELVGMPGASQTTSIWLALALERRGYRQKCLKKDNHHDVNRRIWTGMVEVLQAIFHSSAMLLFNSKPLVLFNLDADFVLLVVLIRVIFDLFFCFNYCDADSCLIRLEIGMGLQFASPTRTTWLTLASMERRDYFRSASSLSRYHDLGLGQSVSTPSLNFAYCRCLVGLDAALKGFTHRIVLRQSFVNAHVLASKPTPYAFKLTISTLAQLNIQLVSTYLLSLKPGIGHIRASSSSPIELASGSQELRMHLNLAPFVHPAHSFLLNPAPSSNPPPFQVFNFQHRLQTQEFDVDLELRGRAGGLQVWEIQHARLPIPESFNTLLESEFCRSKTMYSNFIDSN